jgi:hypothetical protein
VAVSLLLQEVVGCSAEGGLVVSIQRIIVQAPLFIRMRLYNDYLVDEFAWSQHHNAYTVKSVHKTTDEVKWFLVEVRDGGT